MGPIELNKKRIFWLFAAIVALYIVLHGSSLAGDGIKDVASHIPVPGGRLSPQVHKKPPPPDPDEIWDFPTVEPKPTPDPEPAHEPGPDFIPPPDPSVDGAEGGVDVTVPAPAPAAFDDHPIAHLMLEADRQFRIYDSSISTTFRQTVEKYRSKHGRHPPPGFKEWYQFARERNVYNIDDFEQIMDDLRPFWAVEPAEIRANAAYLAHEDAYGAAVIHIRKHKVVSVSFPNWRSETMVDVIKNFIKHLPDMDIAMNKFDQPRVIVPWEDMQELLQKEYDGRAMPPEAADSFTKGMQGLPDVTSETGPDLGNMTEVDHGWFHRPGKQYMDIAAKACPPDSPARNEATTIEEADALYKEPTAGIVTNFNLSSDLCTVGPAIQDLHGLLYSASSIMASHKLVPIFSECKVNINSDILFPANMYYRHDVRYDYNAEEDVDWRNKNDTIIWRGVTSGGVQTEDNWQRMHRQRLVQLFNGTQVSLDDRRVRILTQTPTDDAYQHRGDENTTYESYPDFHPALFADAHADIGFVEAWGCVPNCDFYADIFSWKNQTTLTSQFRSRYLIDVDGHSFSGRWHAFLQSKSLGLKATIFREWHDSRLFAWRHFVPVDNRYDDIYALLSYFMGTETTRSEHAAEADSYSDRDGADTAAAPAAAADDDSPDAILNPGAFVAPHAREAQALARQGREWANRVLRRDDIEIYMFRLLLEYGRLIDDNRDRIGYSGDGGELDKYDAGDEQKWGIGGWRWR